MIYTAFLRSTNTPAVYIIHGSADSSADMIALIVEGKLRHCTFDELGHVIYLPLPSGEYMVEQIICQAYCSPVMAVRLVIHTPSLPTAEE